jgi:general secretion pathway protein K
VLLAVLWMSGVVMWVAFMIAADRKLKTQEDLQALGRIQGLHLAEGGVYEALARMVSQTAEAARLTSEEDNRWRPDGVAREVRYPRGRTMVRVELEGAKLNANTAESPSLTKTFMKAGLGQARAEILAARVIDFRDTDEVRLPNGAEKEEYRAMGLDHLPLDAPMKSLDQILLVPGVGPDLFLAGARAREPRPGEEAPRPGVPLWTLLTVADAGVDKLPDARDGSSLAAAGQERKDREAAGGFKVGQTYRIVSVGRAMDQAPGVTLWVVVRLGGGKFGYEVLFRKVL